MHNVPTSMKVHNAQIQWPHNYLNNTHNVELTHVHVIVELFQQFLHLQPRKRLFPHGLFQLVPLLPDLSHFLPNLTRLCSYLNGYQLLPVSITLVMANSSRASAACVLVIVQTL
ncbi:hypothetical protein V6N13_104366 [Hibiscus sabdariffa]